MIQPESASTAPETVTLSFLLTDIEGSTVWWSRVGEAFSNALALHHAILRREVARHGGRELSEEGDGFLVAFDTPRAAADCAITLQQVIAATTWPGKVEAMCVRMALHLGSVEALAGGGIRGVTLNRAARLRDGAHGGQVICSAAFAEEIAGCVELRELGIFRLRGLPEPERVFQLGWPGMETRPFPPLRLPPAFSNNLPPSFTRFFGREEEVARLRSWILDYRAQPATGAGRAGQVITLTGPGGTGKTRLSLAVAESLLEAFSHAAWFVPLVDVADAARIPAAVRDALRLPPEAAQDPLEQVIALLGSQPSLVVLDNFEQLGEAGLPLLQTLLARLPMLHCVVTSRRRLGLAGEREYGVPPLNVPGSPHCEPGELFACASVQLFVDRAQAARPGFELTTANAVDVAEICRRVEGVPLAVELIAARAGVAAPGEMVRELEHRLELFQSDNPGVPVRQRSLRAAIDWSYDFLPAALQQFFANLAVFRGGWTAEAADEVARTEDLKAACGTARRALGELRAAALVRAEEHGGTLRFRMLETLRQYAEERLAASDTVAHARERHARWACALAEAAGEDLHGSRQAAWLERLDEEHANFMVAFDSDAPLEIKARMASALPYFWMLRGYAREGLVLLLKSFDERASLAPKLRAGVCNAAGILALAGGAFDAAEADFSEALAIFQELGEERNIAGMLTNLGIIAQRKHDYPVCRDRYIEALAIYERLGMTTQRGQLLTNLGGAAVETNDPKARQWLAEALEFLRMQGDDFGSANAWHNLGELALRQERHEEALECFRECVALRRRLGDAGHAAETYAGMALAALGAGARSDGLRSMFAALVLEERFRTPLMPETSTRVAEWLRVARDGCEAAELERLRKDGARIAAEF